MENPPLSYDYVAYIDEAGDPGLKRVKPIDNPGASEWMTLSAVVLSAAREAELAKWNTELLTAVNSRQLAEVHFARLNAKQKISACEYVASLPVRAFVVASNKQNMKGWNNPFAAQIPSDNWYYCWLTRLLLERVTHWIEARSKRDYGEVRKVKLVFSERGGLKYDQLNAYYQWLRMKGQNQKLMMGNIVYETIDMGLLDVCAHAGHDGLKLPDIVASAFFKAADHYDTRGCDTTFAEALRPIMARWPDTKAGKIAGYGVKLMPRLSQLKSCTRPEQLAIFKSYGYPSQWWR